MSTQVENRVVSMEFDNKNFEKNIAQTMKTLEEFDDSLNFKGAEKGFKTLESAAKKCDLSPLDNAVASLEMKFSALQIAGVTAISKIVSSAIDAGTKLVKSLSLDPITSGFAQYETKVQSVQTIMNATGKAIGDVEKTLAKLAIFTDETSYSFGDMVDNIGKFTSNNIELERAANAMQGISNWAAVSGQNSQAASRAMYNLSQALSVGAVTAMDWKSIELANMATKEFKETVIQTAKDMGKLTEEGKNFKGNIVTATNFRETLSDKWFDSDILIATLEKYNSYSDAVITIMEELGVDAQDAMKKIDVYIEESGDKTLEFGRKAFKAAQEAKTFTDAIKATKDAVKTGWQQTFDIIFGNYEEATKMWTNLTTILWDVFAFGAAARNQMLKTWKAFGGRKFMLDTFSKAFQNASAIVEAFSKAFRDVFPPMTGQRLADITKGINKFITQLKLSDDALETVTNAVRTFLLPVKIVANVLEMGAIAAAVLTVKLFRLADSFLAANKEGGIFNNLMIKVFGEERYTRIGNAMNKILTNLGNAFSNLIVWVKGLFSQTPQAESMHRIFEAIGKVLSPIAGWILDRLVDGFELLANLDFSNITNLGTDILNGMVSAFQNIIQYVPPVTANVGEFLQKFSTATPAEFFTLIADGFKQLKLNWDKFKANFTIGGLAKTINTQFNNMMGIVDGLGDAFVRLVERLDPAKILISAFGVSLVGTIWSVKKAIEASTSVMNNFAGILGAIKKRIEPSRINPTVKSLILLAGALTVMALVPAEQLRQATISMIALMSGLTIATGVLTGLSVAVDKLGVKTGAVKQLGLTMTYISGAVLILSAALAVLSTVELNGILPRLVVLGSIMAALLAVSIIMSKNAKEFTKGSGFMIAYALSINLMITALQKLSGVDLTGIQKNLGALIVVVGILGVIGIAASKVKFTTAAGMTTMILNIILLCGMLKLLTRVDMGTILKGLQAFIPIIAAIAAISLALRLAGQNAAKIGATFLALSASIVVLAQGVKMLAKLDAKEVAVGAAAIGGMIVIFGLFTQFAKMDKDKSVAKLGGTFIAMSAAIILLTGAIYLLGNMPENIVTQGTIVVMAILSMFTVLMAIGKESKGAMGAILSMTAAIGALTAALMLLTLIDTKELLGASAAMSIVFVAFGLAMKNLKSIGLKDALGSIALIVLLIGSLSGALYLLANLDNTEKAIASAVSISVVLLGIASMTNLMSSIDGRKYNSYIKMIKLVGLFLIEAVAALSVMSLIDGEGMLEKSASLSLLIVAMTAVSAAIANANIDAKKVAKGALAIDSVFLILGGFVVAIGALDSALGGAIGSALESGGGVMKKLLGVTPAILVFGAIAAALNYLKIDPVIVSKAAAGFDAVVAIIGALVVAIGAIEEVTGGRLSSFVESGGDVILKLGSIIGGFIGNIISGMVGGAVSGALPVIGENLAIFSNSIQPFLQMGKDYDKSINENISNFVGAVTDITRAGQIWNTSGLDFEAFGTDFENFGPHLGNFIKGISDVEFDSSKVDSASNAAKAIANILEVLPQEGGLKGAIFGQTDFGGFVTALGKLGPAIARLASDVDGISENAFDNAIKVLSVVASFAKNDIPASGGFLQTLIGEQNLGTFGSQLEEFSNHFVPFAEKVSGVDESVITNSEIVAKAVGAMAAVKIPATGGFLQDFLGNSDIDTYGEHLDTFSIYFTSFADRIQDIPDVVSQSKTVAQAVSEMAKVDIPSTGGLLSWLTGKNDLATFGNQLQSLGSSLANYYSSLSNINVDKLNNSISSVSKIAALSGDISAFDSASVPRFVYGIEALSTTSIDGFIDTWEGSEKDIANTINRTISNVADYLSDGKSMKDAAENIVSGFIDGIGQNKSKISQTGKNLGTDFATSVRGTRSQQVSAGSYIVSGLSKGIEDSIPDIKKTMTILTDVTVETVEKNLQIASPSKRFIQIGKYIVEGLRKGIMDNQNRADNSILGTAKGIYNTITEFFEIHSPSVKMEEIGKYIVQGIGEGMKKDMTVEEIATKKMENIFTAFSDAASLQSSKFKQNDILYDIWQLENSLASDEKKTAKEREYRQNELNEAVQTYNGLLAEQQALDKIGADVHSQKYLDLQNSISEQKREIVNQAKELVDFDISSVQAARDQVAAIESLKAEQRDLAYTTWELTHKNATTQEKYDKKEELTKQKLNDQQNEYNRLVQSANDLISQGYDMESTQVLTALNKINEQYNTMLETAQSINDLSKQRKNDAIEESSARKDLVQQYYDYLKSEYVQDVIKNGTTAFDAGATEQERLKYFQKYAQEMYGLTEDLQIKVDDESLETLIDVDANLQKLAESGALTINLDLNVDKQLQNVLSKVGFDESFLAEFPIFDETLVYEKASSSGSAAGNGFTDGLTNSVSESVIPEWLQNILNGGKETAKDGGEEAADGYGDGFFGELARKADQAKKDMEAWGSAQVEAGKEGLGVNSPSIYMAEAGEWFVEGFIKGLDNKETAAYKAVENLCKKIMNTVTQTLITPSSNVFSSVTSAINSMESSGSFNPVIRPVIDMDDLKKDISKTNKLLDSTLPISPFGNTTKTAAQTASEIAKTKSQNEAILSQGQGPKATSGDITFQQIINSPKTPSRLELYRDGQALTSQIKTVFKSK